MVRAAAFRKIACAILVTHDLRDGAAHALHLHPRDPLHMRLKVRSITLLVLIIGCAATHAAFAQDYPAKAGADN
jgi:hypothetical protein